MLTRKRRHLPKSLDCSAPYFTPTEIRALDVSKRRFVIFPVCAYYSTTVPVYVFALCVYYVDLLIDRVTLVGSSIGRSVHRYRSSLSLIAIRPFRFALEKIVVLPTVGCVRCPVVGWLTVQPCTLSCSFTSPHSFEKTLQNNNNDDYKHEASTII